MNHHLSWLIVLGLAAGMAACDRKEVSPRPKTGAWEVKQQARTPVSAVEKRPQSGSIDAIGRATVPILNEIARPTGRSDTA